MDQDPFRRAAAEFKLSLEEHARRMRDEMEQARERIQSAMDRVRTEIERARADFERQMEEARERMRAGTPPRDDPVRAARPAPKRRRPPRKRPGGEPASVKPRPNPTPLTDGAEAPVD